MSLSPLLYCLTIRIGLEVFSVYFLIPVDITFPYYSCIYTPPCIFFRIFFSFFFFSFYLVLSHD